MFIVIFRSWTTLLEVLEFGLRCIQEDVHLLPSNAVGLGFTFGWKTISDMLLAEDDESTALEDCHGICSGHAAKCWPG
jgi:hypothetical protein